MATPQMIEAKLAALYAGLSGRPSPEAVAHDLLEVLPDLDAHERSVLTTAARGYGYYSRMNTDFLEVASLSRVANSLAALLGQPTLDASVGRDPGAISDLLGVARRFLALQAGQTDFKADRLNRAARAAHGLGDLSRRRYNKLFRITARLEGYAAELDDQLALFELGRFAKTAFASSIPTGAFEASPNSAAFVAWYAANLARRNLFIAGPQARAFDSVAELLLARCTDDPETSWYAIAHVFPRADILDRLAEAGKLNLLNNSLIILQDAAARLEVMAVREHISLDTMIVHRDNDSSTWNLLAGAYNRARDYWIALVYALGAADIFEAFLPGKTLRLMAADVAYIHRRAGGDLHDDTGVFAELPKPWDVLAGREACGRALVESVCRRQGIDPTTSAWAAPRPHSAVAPWAPTPESVHGVVVHHPELALWLRKVGAFSGQGLNLGAGI